MRIADFDYDLPEELIAQRPAERRDASRLMLLRGAGEPEHHRFHELPELLSPGDLLVINDARVIPARLEATRSTGGRVELLFLGPAAEEKAEERSDVWEALARPARRVRTGERLTLAAGEELEVVGMGAEGRRHLRARGTGSVAELLERHGRMPLPPYIRVPEGQERERLDRERYQTVYATRPGAVAAPTAGLHFTGSLLERLWATGVEVATVSLHVGPGTFRPVTAERVQEHVMEGERFELPEETVAAVEAARGRDGRVIAVGTTSVRTLETAGGDGRLQPGTGTADLFITPGHRFRVVDGMITNFHLPRSTPLLMAAALVGRERLLAAYREAVVRRYRFYSYGDAMLLLP